MLGIRSMRYFVAVVEERSITRAAESLDMGQPPLSNQIKALENRLGIKLLNRMARGVEPTPAGLALYQSVVQILDDIDQAVANARCIDRELSGQLHIGVTRTTIAHPLTKQALAQFISDHPQINLNLITNGSVELNQALERKEIDCALARPVSIESTSLKQDKVAIESMLAALPGSQEDSDSSRKAINLQSLADLKAVLYRDSTDPSLYQKIHNAFKQAGLALNDVQEVPSAQVALDLVSTGLGFTLVPDSLAETSYDNVVYRELDLESAFNAEICLYTRYSETREEVHAFRELLLNTIRSDAAQRL